MLGVLVGFGFSSTGASAATAEGVATAVEGWHELPPLSPLPAPPREFPGDTLHIAVDVGRETAQTFLSFDLAALPAGAAVEGGTLTLPVAGGDAGTSNPQAAEMVACLLTEPPVAVERGSAEERPAFDCGASSPAIFREEAGRPSFTVDLGPLGSRWSSGTVNHGVAVVPKPEGRNPIASWRVVLHGKARSVPDSAPVTATLAFPDPPAAAAPPAAGPAEPLPAAAGPPSQAPFPFGPDAPAFVPSAPQDFGLPAVTSLPPELLAGTGSVAPPAADSAAAPAPVAAPAAAPVTFQTVAIEPFLRAYPIAWALPLVVATLASALATSLGRPVPVAASGSLVRGLFLGPPAGSAG